MISWGTDWHYCHKLKAWLSGMLAVPHTHGSSISPSTPWQAQVEDMPGLRVNEAAHVVGLLQHLVQLICLISAYV